MHVLMKTLINYLLVADGLRMGEQAELLCRVDFPLYAIASVVFFYAIAISGFFYYAIASVSFISKPPSSLSAFHAVS